MSNQMFEEVIRKNVQACIKNNDILRKRMEEELTDMHKKYNVLYQEVRQLQEKYNLLLTKNFNGGSTAE